MEITNYELDKIEAGPKGNWIFLTLHTDTGLTGRGEASQSGDDEALVWILKNRLLPQLMGIKPLQERNKFFKNIEYENIKSLENFYFITAKSAIDQALFDLKSRFFEIPLNFLWGGFLKEKIPLYANINRALTERNPEAFAEMALKAVNHGYQAVKIAPFDGVSPYLERKKFRCKVDRAFARIKAVKERIGEEKDLMIDCHGRFAAEDVPEIIESLDKFDIYWLEEPVSTNRNLSGLKKIRKKTNIKIAGGEKENFDDLFKLMEENLLDIIMPDIKHIGSVTDFIRITEAARYYSTGVSPHNPSGPVSTAFSAHICSFIDNFIYLEFPFHEIAWRAEFTEPEEPVANGFYHIDREKSGIGISFKQEGL